MGDLRQPDGTDLTRCSNRSRDVRQSGLYLPNDGNGEGIRATFRDRDNGDTTAVEGEGQNCRVDYSHLNIRGGALGSREPSSDVASDSGSVPIPVVSTETNYGWSEKVKLAAPVCMGFPGSTEIARKNWEQYAVGAALSGLTLVCGENVCGTDPGLELNGCGKIVLAPEIDRRIETYKRYHRGFGEILVQMNAEDARLGVAEYVIEKHGLEAIELKWGELAGLGENRVLSLERALEWKRRGAIVTPNPSDPVIQAGYQCGVIKEFARHSRLGFLDEEGFVAECVRLRGLGFRRITVRAGVYDLDELALAMKWCSKAKIDLLTIGGAAGGTSGSPWPATHGRGILAIHLHSAAAAFADRLASKGERVADLALAGGFRAEDDLFKCLALGWPHVKAACVDCAPMIPDMAGESTGGWVEGGNPTRPAAEETTAAWEQVVGMVGREEMLRILPGAVGIYSHIQMLRGGLQRRMAGAGCFHVAAITRERLVSLTRQCAEVTGIPLAMDDCREEAEAVVDG